ncbi:ABC transporter ATP-binding protein [Actinophytocola oryzae]|uniref:ABC-type multidrug transport system fused ATPase/permease subunit n=1 Tax=Actinophytocola oryzae TaxID=502181 RepID=A0A4R7V2P3_9PSEU|nr:ABC transporter ATP-binding protein [Actinophytocola oryzae]TDV43633.1 ABC-type multidrug transport system fused ATPase/permease subunit [Actinophytocola oryzae]
MRLQVPYADPGVPDARGPLRFLWWLVRCQRWRVARGAALSITWMVLLMLPPYLMARAIDDGLRARDLGALGVWVAVLAVTGAANSLIGITRHRTMTFIRTDASYRTVQVVIRHAVRVGAELPRRVSSGEVVSIGAADLDRIARTMTSTGPGVGAAVTYVAVAVLLVGISPLLATVVLVGVPLLVVAVGPLLNRLRSTESTYRERQGSLTARAGDIVAGLRVLCGIGGKDMFADRYRRGSQDLRVEGYRVGAVSSWIQGVAVGLPSLFLAAVTWLAARMTAAGEITVGEMVAVYGYVAVLATPVFFLIEGAQDISRGVVAARRVTTVLAIEPAVADTPTASAPPGPAALYDPDSGLTVWPGELLAVAAATPVEATDLVDRLGRYTDSAVTWGDTPLSAVPLSAVRDRILVADNDAYLFAGPLREAVSPRDRRDDDAVWAAIHVAMAQDIVDALPHGLSSLVEAQGRSVSGGQRQRLRLVRALLADPEVLLLVEPTSAVDAHTESVIAERLVKARGGRTTVLVATSPLLLDRADRVAYLVDGRVVATGTHTDLLATQPGYRTLAFRGSDEELVSD